MSYSRWNTSTWYTYWSGDSPSCEFKLPTRKLRYSQIFEICGIPDYQITYGDLMTKDLRTILDQVKSYFLQPCKREMLVDIRDGEWIYEEREIPGTRYTEQEMVELMGYLNKFVKDVHDSFELKTFFRTNWWIPLRSKIRRLFNKKSLY